MSSCGYGNAFTDDERSAGIPALLCGDYDDYDDYDCDAKENKKEIESSVKEYVNHKSDNSGIETTKMVSSIDNDTLIKNEETEPSIKEYVNYKLDDIEIDITKMVLGLDNPIEIKNKVIRKILLESLDGMIDNYMRKEALPFELVKVSKQRNGLEILIKYFLKNDGGYILTKELIDEINIFLDDIYRNNKFDIVYERVGKIQKFIHQKIDDKYGYGAHLNLNTKKMKNILSASRLHLNIFDIKNYNMNTLIQLIEKSKEKSFREYMSSNNNILLSSNKSYYRMWKARGIKSLIYFLEPSMQNKIYKIYYLDRIKDITLFQDQIISIYLNKLQLIENPEAYNQLFIEEIKLHNQLSESEWIFLNIEESKWQEQV